MRGACDVVDSEEVFERGYEVVLVRLLRSLVAQADHAQAEHVWTWTDR